MNRDPRKRARRAFVPSFEDRRLEERVVLSAAPSLRFAAVQAARTGLVTSQQVVQVRALYGQQFRAAMNDLKNHAINQLVSTYNDAGLAPRDRLSFQQYDDLRNNIAGAVNATAIRLSSQYGLLPGADNLSFGVQNALLGESRRSLLGRLDAVANSRSDTRNEVALKNAIVRAIDNTFNAEAHRLSNYFNRANFNRLLAQEEANSGFTAAAVSTRQFATASNPLQAFMVERAIGRLNSNLGGLAGGIGNAALSTLYGGNVNNPITTDQAVLGNFNNQLNSAIGNLNYQFGSALSVIPGVAGNQQVFGQLRRGIFGDGTGANVGLLGGINGLTGGGFGYSDFQNSLTPAFQNAYQGVAQPLYSSAFPGLTIQNPNNFGPGGDYVLRTNFTGNNFFNGFNNGFGSGFTGFGTAPTGFNSNFSNGFNNAVGGYNFNNGFNLPNFGASIPGSDVGYLS